jgi:hypothetical protein
MQIRVCADLSLDYTVGQIQSIALRLQPHDKLGSQPNNNNSLTSFVAWEQ